MRIHRAQLLYNNQQTNSQIPSPNRVRACRPKIGQHQMLNRVGLLWVRTFRVRSNREPSLQAEQQFYQELIMNSKGKRDPIPGYTGCTLRRSQQEAMDMQHIAADGQIPGYVGFISSVRSENLYGKTYGKITQECYHGNYQKGSQLPPDVRFMSTTKDAFVDPKIIKDKEAQEGRINGLKTSTFYGAAKNILNSSTLSMNKGEKMTNLTYQEAVKMAYK